jgi:hypothetical protein
MGKSTLLKYLFLITVLEQKAYPVFLSLRQLRLGKTLLAAIGDELCLAGDEALPAGSLLEIVRRGGFLFLFDGYDEVPTDIRDYVLEELSALVTKADKNKYIITSRPDIALLGLPGFHRYSIQPLAMSEAFALLRLYDAEGPTADELIRVLQDDPPHSVVDCLSNPLLVSLLYKAFEYGKKIPLKPHVYYRQVYDALFESHDLSKGGAFQRQKFCGLDREDFHLLMRRVGFESTREATVEYDRDRLVSLITRARGASSWLTFSIDRFIKDLLETVPLFQLDGVYFRWVHKSFQDYFAAQFVCTDTKGSQQHFLRELSSRKRYQRYENVLRMCYDIDFKTFRSVIIRDLIDSHLATLEELQTTRAAAFPLDLLERRAEAMCGYRYVLVPPSVFSGRASTSELERRCGQQLGHFEYLASDVTVYGGFGHGMIVYADRHGEILRLLRDHHNPLWRTQSPDEQANKEVARVTIFETLRKSGAAVPVPITNVMAEPWNYDNVWRLLNTLITEFGTIDTVEARRALLELDHEAGGDDLNKLLS